MAGESYVIYGLDHQARSLASMQVDQEKPVFLIGSLSLRFLNQVNMLEYDEDTNQISKKTFDHPAGEIWHISCSPSDRNFFSTCYNSTGMEKKVVPGCSIWSLENFEAQANGENQQLTELCHSDDLSDFNSVACFQWQPAENGDKALIAADNKLLLTAFESATSSMKTSRQICVENGLTSKISVARWNPHHHSNLICAAVDSNLKAYDIRSKEDQPAFSIEHCHQPVVRNLDFNPNRQYYLASCGDDCKVKFWDFRSTKFPLLTIAKHSHWVWSVRYNPVHDELFLSCSGDSRLILHCATSVSSESAALEENQSSNEDEDSDLKFKKNSEKLGDGVVKIYDEHEDSVYCSEWSFSDPWLFASLSYDGRVIINKVLRHIKYKILQL